MAEKSAKPKRRLVKPAESLREKTEKANQPAKPKRQGVLWMALRYIGAPFRWIGRALAKFGKFLGKFRVFRFIGKILWPTYFRNSWKELRLVTWPNSRETWQLVLAVIIFSLVFGLLIALADYGLDKLFKQLIIK